MAQLVEHHLAKVRVASSNLVIRSVKAPVSSNAGRGLGIFRTCRHAVAVDEFLWPVLGGAVLGVAGARSYVLTFEFEVDSRVTPRVFLLCDLESSCQAYSLKRFSEPP